MKVEHIAIDGSVVTIEAPVDLSSQATATGWAIVPSLMRAHPFTSSPAGHSSRVAEKVRTEFKSIEWLESEEYSVQGNPLRLAVVRLPTATGGARQLTVGAWEGEHGCLITSLIGSARKRLIEVFDTLKFGERPGGVVISSPVVGRPRMPEVTKEIPELGVLGIRPATANELERVPSSKGYRTDGGELFRIREASRAMLYVSDSAVVSITPLDKLESGRSAQADQAMLDVALQLKVDWRPGNTR
jgi:hypothetical protein